MKQKAMLDPSLFAAEYSSTSVLDFSKDSREFELYIPQKYLEFLENPGQDLQDLYDLRDRNAEDFSAQKKRHPFYRFYVDRAKPESLEEIYNQLRTYIDENHLQVFDAGQVDYSITPESIGLSGGFREELLNEFEYYILPEEHEYRGVSRREVTTIVEILYEELIFSITSSPILHRFRKTADKVKQAGIATLELGNNYIRLIEEYIGEGWNRISDEYPEAAEKIKEFIDIKRKVSNIRGISWITMFVGWILCAYIPIVSKPYDILTQILSDP